MRRKLLARPSPAMVVALVALVSSLAGGAVAATLITGDDIAKRTIASKHIKAGAVKTNKVKDGTLLKQDFKAGELTTSPNQPGPRGPDGWTPLNLDQFENYGGNFSSARYRKDGNGMVHLRGVVARSNVSPASDDRISVLPEGYRPSERLIFAVATGEPLQFGRVDIAPGGDVLWIAGGSGEPDHTSLDGISFWPD